MPLENLSSGTPKRSVLAERNGGEDLPITNGPPSNTGSERTPISEWDEDHPGHFVGQSPGAKVVCASQQMLAVKGLSGLAMVLLPGEILLFGWEEDGSISFVLRSSDAALNKLRSSKKCSSDGGDAEAILLRAQATAKAIAMVSNLTAEGGVQN